MEFSSKLIKVHLSNYLANLPLPNSFLGIFKLGGKELFIINIKCVEWFEIHLLCISNSYKFL
jgi:hypothetical protein